MSFELSSPRIDLATFSSGLESWLKDSVSAAVCVNVAEIDPLIKLHPEEKKYVLNAVLARRAEFATGRYCAREILTKLGYAEIAIPVGPKMEPIWPTNVSGSISHDQGIAVAVISADQHISGLGIDLLGLESRIDGTGSGLIADESEISSVGEMLHSVSYRAYQDVSPLLLIFSAKESAIKAISPSLEHYLDFREIQIESRANILRGRFLNSGVELEIHWNIIEKMIITFTLISPNSIPPNCL